MLLLTAMRTPGLAWLTGIVKGCADACAGIALPYLHAHVFGRTSSGQIYAVNRTLGVVGSGLGPLLFGVARDRQGAFAPSLRGAALLPLAVTLAAVLVRAAPMKRHLAEEGPRAPEARRETEMARLLDAAESNE